MTPYLNQLYDALRTMLAAVWPEVVANGIFRAEQAEIIPWVEFTPPYAVIVMGDMRRGQWGMSNLAYETTPQIFYVAEADGSDDAITNPLELARDYLYQNDPAFGQVLDIPDIDYSDQLPPNIVFVQKGMAHRAGRLTPTILIGQEGPNT